MDQDPGGTATQATVDHTVGDDPTADDLARLADELLEEVAALRRQFQGLRDSLAGVPRPADEPPRDDGDVSPPPRSGSESLQVMVLQMAFAGEDRDNTKAYIRSFGVEDSDEIVDEVFDRVQAPSDRPRRRRLFARRGP